MVTRRHVFHLAGYDAIGPGWYQLFHRELHKFSKTWNVTTTSPQLRDAEWKSGAGCGFGDRPCWSVTTSAPNWSVKTTYELLLWDDIVLRDGKRPMFQRLRLSLGAFLDVVGSGTFLRYWAANWQYALFFLFPFVLPVVFAIGAVAVAIWFTRLIGLSGLPYVFCSGLLAAGLFVLLLRWPGRRLRLGQGLDDWNFFQDYVYGRCTDIEVRLGEFSERLVCCDREGGSDEILIVGHSMGATLALEVIARAIARDPNFARRGARVCLLTVGSTIAKFTLHPAGACIRRCAAQIVEDPSISWAEYQARADAISFYKFDPVQLSRFLGHQTSGKPLLRRVKLHEMLRRSTYWRFRLRFLRLHYQFVMANECRSTYDYFMMVCGPVAFSQMVLSPEGAVDFFAPDGSLHAPDAMSAT